MWPWGSMNFQFSEMFVVSPIMSVPYPGTKLLGQQNQWSREEETNIFLWITKVEGARDLPLSYPLIPGPVSIGFGRNYTTYWSIVKTKYYLLENSDSSLNTNSFCNYVLQKAIPSFYPAILFRMMRNIEREWACCCTSLDVK